MEIKSLIERIDKMLLWADFQSEAGALVIDCKTVITKLQAENERLKDSISRANEILNRKVGDEFDYPVSIILKQALTNEVK